MKGYTIQNSIDLLEKKGGGGGGGASSAADVSYDNTTSHLTADDVQEAIDEINAKIPTTAAQIPYVNTSSGLTADDVQEAIDEIDASVDTINSKALKFGTAIHDDSISNFGQISDTYTATATGIMEIAFTPTGESAARLQVSCGGVQSGVVVTGGYSGFLTIPVNSGEDVTILAINNGSIPFIDIRPIEFSAPASTRKKKGGN